MLSCFPTGSCRGVIWGLWKDLLRWMKSGPARGPVYRQAKVCMKIRGLKFRKSFFLWLVFFFSDASFFFGSWHVLCVSTLCKSCPDQSWAELVKKAGKVDEKQVGIATSNGIMVEHGGTAHDKLILSESPWGSPTSFGRAAWTTWIQSFPSEFGSWWRGLPSQRFDQKISRRSCHFCLLLWLLDFSVALTGYRVDLHTNDCTQYPCSSHLLGVSHEESRLGSHLPPVEDASVVAKLIVSQRKLNVCRGGVPYVQSSEYSRYCCAPLQSNGVDLFKASNAPPTSTVSM